ncbi:amidohydrolase family protein [Sphingomonas sp. YL-JM2C]
MADYDIVIRNGLLFDGTGAEPLCADLAVRDGRIARIGSIEEKGEWELDAGGCIVTPGFIDVHTHYDGQAIWSERMTPSSAHGVTTAVMGNCGVGFAPCRADDRPMLIAAMEGVEDIPEVVMTEGLTWTWESFPEYLQAVAERRHDIDLCSYVPHSALRVYAMGERGARREPATAEDRARMAALVGEAVRAGAFGFATSNFAFHRRIDGALIPSFDAAEAELLDIARAVADAGGGVFQMVLHLDQADASDARRSIEMLGRISRLAGVVVTFTLSQDNAHPARWRDILEWMAEQVAAGAELRAQIFPRPVGIIMGHQLSLNPFSDCPTYKALPADMEERMARLRDPAVRARLLDEMPDAPVLPIHQLSRSYDRMFPMSDPPDYEPPLASSVAARAVARGVSPEAVAYDLMLADGGRGLLFIAAANYADGDLRPVLEMMKDPNVILGLGDGGAHYGLICDSSYPTFVLTHLARDRPGERLDLPMAVRALSDAPARLMGLADRGRLAPGLRADINVIDHAGLALDVPRVAFDLPAGGRRLDQAATGFRCTLVGGRPIVIDDEPTGLLPGQLVRSGAAWRDATARTEM